MKNPYTIARLILLLLFALIISVSMKCQNYFIAFHGIVNDSTTVYSQQMDYVDTAKAGDTICFVYEFSWYNNTGGGFVIRFNGQTVGQITNSAITAEQVPAHSSW